MLTEKERAGLEEWRDHYETRRANGDPLKPFERQRLADIKTKLRGFSLAPKRRASPSPKKARASSDLRLGLRELRTEMQKAGQWDAEAEKLIKSLDPGA